MHVWLNVGPNLTALIEDILREAKPRIDWVLMRLEPVFTQGNKPRLAPNTDKIGFHKVMSDGQTETL